MRNRYTVILGALAAVLSLVVLSSSVAWGVESPDGSTLAMTGNCLQALPDVFVGDFDGDGLDDLGLYQSDENAFYVSLSTGKSFGDSGSGRWVAPNEFGNSGGRYLIGDYNGDGRDDLGFINPSDNTFHVSLSTKTRFGAAGSGRWIGPNEFGHSGGTYYVGYFNGGLKADLGFFDPSNNTFHVSLSTGSEFNAPHSGRWIDPNEFGNANGQYVIGDFNEDGSEDLGFFEPVNRAFHVTLSDGTDFGKSGSGIWIPPNEFGNANGTFFSGDFDGDGDADLGFFEPGNNSFWVALSDKHSFPFTDRKQWVAPGAFGHRDGQYLIADYNGGGKDDLGFYNPGDRTFHVGLSTGAPGFDFKGSGRWASLYQCRTYMPMVKRR
jgi:hypothetical protein